MAHTVQQTLNTGPHDNTGATNASFAVNPTAGRSVIVVGWGFGSSGGGGFGSPTVTDNQGNTYATPILSPLVNSTIRCFVTWVHNITASGTFTITVTPSQGAGNYYSWSALEVSGLDTAGRDQSASNSGTSATPASGTTGTTAVDSELAVAAVVHAATLSSDAVNGAWTQIQEELNSLSHQGGENDRRDLSAIGTYSCDWTFNTSSAYSALIVTFADTGPAFTAQGTGTFAVAGGAQNYGSFSGTGTSTFAVTGSYTPPVGFAAQGTGSFVVTGVLSGSARFDARGDAQFLVTPSIGRTGSFIATGRATFSVIAAPQTAAGSFPSAPPAALAPYGNLANVSALIHGFNGAYIFDQYGNSPYAGIRYPLENLEFETRVPGGDATATVYTRLHGTTMNLPSPGSFVVLSDLAGAFWLGVFDYPDVDYWTGGANVALHCLGVSAYADDEVFLERTVFEDTDTARDIFITARDRLIHGFNNTDDFISVNAAIPIGENTQSYRGKTAQMAFNDAAAMGSLYADADALIWQFRAPMTAGYPSTVPILEVYPLQEAPMLTLDVADGYEIRQSGPARSRVRNQIFVNYGTGTGDILHETASQQEVAMAFDADGWADIDYRPRMMWIDTPGGELYWGARFAAQRIAQANLSKNGRLQTNGEQLTIPHDGQGGHRPVVGAGPDTLPIWRIRAGYRLTLNNRPTFTGLGSRRNDLVTGTRFSLKEAKTQISTGTVGDSRTARRMTGLVTLRQLMDLPPLARPNRPLEWHRVNIELGPWDPHEDPGKLMVEFPHIIRTVTVFVWRLLSETADLESVDFLVGVGPQGTPGSYDVLAEQTVALSGDNTRVQVMSGLSRTAEPGEMYTFFFRNPVPAGMRCLGVVGVDRMKVVE